MTRDLLPVLKVIHQTDRHLLLNKFSNGIREQWVVCLCCGGVSKQHPLRELSCVICGSTFPKEKQHGNGHPLIDTLTEAPREV